MLNKKRCFVVSEILIPHLFSFESVIHLILLMSLLVALSAQSNRNLGVLDFMLIGVGDLGLKGVLGEEDASHSCEGTRMYRQTVVFIRR